MSGAGIATLHIATRSSYEVSGGTELGVQWICLELEGQRAGFSSHDSTFPSLLHILHPEPGRKLSSYHSPELSALFFLSGDWTALAAWAMEDPGLLLLHMLHAACRRLGIFSPDHRWNLAGSLTGRVSLSIGNRKRQSHISGLYGEGVSFALDLLSLFAKW